MNHFRFVFAGKFNDTWCFTSKLEEGQVDGEAVKQ